MVPSQGISILQPIAMVSRSTGTAASGVVDTLGYGNVLLALQRGATGANIAFVARHCSASTTLYASATAFSPAATNAGLSAGTNAFTGIEILNPDHKRYIRVRLSTTGATNINGVLALLSKGGTIPLSDTSRGFVSIQTIPTQP